MTATFYCRYVQRFANSSVCYTRKGPGTSRRPHSIGKQADLRLFFTRVNNPQWQKCYFGGPYYGMLELRKQCNRRRGAQMHSKASHHCRAAPPLCHCKAVLIFAWLTSNAHQHRECVFTVLSRARENICFSQCSPGPPTFSRPTPTASPPDR